MESIIRTDHLTKYYGKVHALNNVSISIKKGEIYGFLGLNGAGKSTTILLLLGIIHPTSGSSFLYGEKVSAGNNRLWNNVGYLLERQYSYPELTGSVEIRDRVKGCPSNHGVTIFISSHILEEISRLATRIGIIHQGNLIQEIDTNELENLCKKRLVLDADNKEAARLKLIENGFTVNLSGEGLLEGKGDEAIKHPENIANILVYAGIPPRLLKVEEENLE